jgi:hypothetical protein
MAIRGMLIGCIGGRPRRQAQAPRQLFPAGPFHVRAGSNNAVEEVEIMSLEVHWGHAGLYIGAMAGGVRGSC